MRFTSVSSYFVLESSMMVSIRRICHFLPIRRFKPRYIIRYLFVVAMALYILLYSTKNVVENTQSCVCNCANKSKKTKSTSSYSKQGAEVELDVKGRTMKTFLLVVVLTGPNNVRRRNSMRSTWLNVTSNYISVTRLFVVGTAGIRNEKRKLLQEEHKLKGDMLLLENVKDEYKQLTRKLLHTLMWISQQVECSYIMKVDDDTFARLDVILSELKTKYHNVENLYWGFHRGNSRVKHAGPWAEKKWILSDHYLPYAHGGGYIISMKLAQYVANISSLVVLYNSEDVSLGVWLSPINLTRVHDARFDTEWKSRGCRNVHIVSHKQSIGNMSDKFVQLRDHNQLCAKEEYLRKSFIYNWNVPPSYCCERKNGIP